LIISFISFLIKKKTNIH